MKLFDQLTDQFMKTLTPLEKENRIYAWMDKNQNVLFQDELEGAMQDWLSEHACIALPQITSRDDRYLGTAMIDMGDLGEFEGLFYGQDDSYLQDTISVSLERVEVILGSTCFDVPLSALCEFERQRLQSKIEDVLTERMQGRGDL